MLALIAIHSRCAVSEDSAVHVLIEGSEYLVSEHPVGRLKSLFPGTLQVIAGVVD
jgi:hypothetical protein